MKPCIFSSDGSSSSSLSSLRLLPLLPHTLEERTFLWELVPLSCAVTLDLLRPEDARTARLGGTGQPLPGLEPSPSTTSLPGSPGPQSPKRSFAPLWPPCKSAPSPSVAWLANSPAMLLPPEHGPAPSAPRCKSAPPGHPSKPRALMVPSLLGSLSPPPRTPGYPPNNPALLPPVWLRWFEVALRGSPDGWPLLPTQEPRLRGEPRSPRQLPPVEPPPRLCGEKLPVLPLLRLPLASDRRAPSSSSSKSTASSPSSAGMWERMRLPQRGRSRSPPEPQESGESVFGWRQCPEESMLHSRPLASAPRKDLLWPSSSGVLEPSQGPGGTSRAAAPTFTPLVRTL